MVYLRRAIVAALVERDSLPCPPLVRGDITRIKFMGSASVSSRLMLVMAFIAAFLVHVLLFGITQMVSILREAMSLSRTPFGPVFSVSVISLVQFRLRWGLPADRRG